MTQQYSAGLRAATMTSDIREVRTQEASSEAKRPMGQTWSARERRKRCDQAYPIFSHVRTREAGRGCPSNGLSGVQECDKVEYLIIRQFVFE